MSALEWRLDDVQGDTGALSTTCELTVRLGGVTIWPSRGREDGIEIQIDDLLSHLTEFWKPLLLRQTYPLVGNPARPTALRSEAEKRWGNLPQDIVAREDEILEMFQDCHDISRCFAGYFGLPPLWLLRMGDEMAIDTGHSLNRLPFAAAVAALASVGDRIALRLSSAGTRWEALVAAWRRRDLGDALSLLRWATSLDADTARALAHEGLLERPTTVAEAANDDNELRLAARMASALPFEQIRLVLTRVSAFPKTESAFLDEMTARSRQHFDDALAKARPHEQGEGLARFIRDQLRLSHSARFDVLGLFEKLAVKVEAESLQATTLDALAVWGRRHGPAVLLNTTSDRHRGAGDLRRRRVGRVTLAHELCHLLIDAEHALSAVEVLNNSRMPITMEQRARAFAAELLAPTQGAADIWIAARQPNDYLGVKPLLGRIARQFDVTQTVASWKLEHGARLHQVDLAPVLNAIIPHR